METPQAQDEEVLEKLTHNRSFKEEDANGNFLPEDRENIEKGHDDKEIVGNGHAQNFEATEVTEDANGSLNDNSVRDMPEDEASDHYFEEDFARKGVVWPEKAAALRNFVRERGIVVSKAISRLSGKKESQEQVENEEKVIEEAMKEESNTHGSAEVGENRLWSAFNFIYGNQESDASSSQREIDEHVGPLMKGVITFFSMSGCPECRAVRTLLRDKELRFVEINLDVFPQRRLELEERTGTASVPQVFFNEQLVGGIDELNALQRSGELDEKIKEVTENEASANAPVAPVYGEDEPENEILDEFAGIVEKLRQKLQVKDRFLKYRVFNKCFVGSEAVDFLAEDLSLEREEAVELGRKLAAKHFFHHVLQEHLFEDGNNFYRFLEHDPMISSKCFNIRGITNDAKPKPANEVCKRLSKLIFAIYEAHVSEDGKHVNYQAIARSEQFRRYVKMVEDLQRVDLLTLTKHEKISLLLNIYNAMVIHAIILLGHPNGPLERLQFFGDFQYVIGGYPYSLSAIQNGILRANQRPPYTLTKPFGALDKRSQVSLVEPEPLIHFALSCGTCSSPAVRCYSSEAIEAELRFAARAFFEDGGIYIDSTTKTLHFSKILKWYSADFGKTERDMIQWVANHVDATNAEELLTVLEGNNPIRVVYQPYDWSLNL
ncbi:hypothetical protein O6H91_13G030700 [Diphasiastrum complanatum]|uniref:Uncharacterized protein n=2 Tax=Diphasiastrum complanatum TaxID=34168 RepID=A0ACC2BTE2_DIPCM|nr:hypothetical protein O6H91_13G030700 [Diphasiastrum complanatum]KAJ7533040.1 hypothetical protein O6H91_13G030700 [Diphasiastrum complanatum]